MDRSFLTGFSSAARVGVRGAGGVSPLSAVTEEDSGKPGRARKTIETRHRQRRNIMSLPMDQHGSGGRYRQRGEAAGGSAGGQQSLAGQDLTNPGEAFVFESG